MIHNQTFRNAMVRSQPSTGRVGAKTEINLNLSGNLLYYTGIRITRKQTLEKTVIKPRPFTDSGRKKQTQININLTTRSIGNKASSKRVDKKGS